MAPATHLSVNAKCVRPGHRYYQLFFPLIGLDGWRIITNVEGLFALVNWYLPNFTAKIVTNCSAVITATATIVAVFFARQSEISYSQC